MEIPYFIILTKDKKAKDPHNKHIKFLEIKVKHSFIANEINRL